MEELSGVIGSHDSGRYDNDFEKLPHDEEVHSTTDLAESISPGGDTKNSTGLDTVGSEATASSRKSKLNVEDIPFEKPQPVTSDEGAVCTSCCFMTRTIDPRVKDLLLWRDVKTSGIVFGSTLVVFLSLAMFSIISVISYLSLAVLAMTASYCVYSHIMATVKKTEVANPFRKYLDMEIKFPEDVAHRYGDIIAKHVTKVIERLRGLFFVDTILESFKFALLLWVMTFIGGWFNGMTLLIIGDILLFSLPKVYEMYQSQIDDAAKMVCDKVSTIWKQIEEKIPMVGKKKKE